MNLSKQALIALGVTGAGVLGCSRTELTREQLDKMLEETAKRPVTSELSLGALCYEMAAPPERIEYHCPLCKTKTLHAKWENVGSVQKVNRLRQQMKRIKELKLDAMLDETDLCNQCRRDKATDTMDFYILVTIDKRLVRTKIGYYDLSQIIAFLEKKDVWKADNDATYPLKDELPRIRTILGMDGGEDKTAK